jgi:WXG100 family type VII secretion target
MSGPINVSPVHLESAARTFQTTSDEILQLLGQLNTAASNVCMDWSGRSRESFDNLWSRWRTELEQLSQVIGELGDHLVQAAVLYTEADEENMPASPTG